MNKPADNSRFALVESGRITALVADGEPTLPEWPADLSTVEDGDLTTLESAYQAEFERLAADPSTAIADLTALAERIESLGVEAHVRMTAEPEAPAAVEPEAPAAVEPPAPVEPDEDRAAAIDALRGRITPAPVEPEPAPEPGVTREDLIAAVGVMAERTATAAAQAAVAAVAQAIPAAPAAAPAPVSAADLGAFRPRSLAPTATTGTTRTRVDARLVTSADVPNRPLGAEIDNISDLRDAMIARHRGLGHASGVNEESVSVAHLDFSVDPSHDLRDTDWEQARRKVQDIVGPQAVGVDPFTGREALIASGGLAAPVEPYYPQMVIAQAARPVRDALPTFMADRGGIRLVLPPSLATLLAATQPGKYTDGVTNTDTSLVSATAAFTAADVGSYVSGTGIVNGTKIVTRTNATTVVLDTATTATATAVTFTISGRNPNNLGAPVGLQSVAQDAAGPPSTVKYTYDVPLGSQAEFDVYSVYTSLQFANLTSRTFPEQVEANIRLADALAARVAETQMLDVISLWSTLFTGAKTFGSARQLLAQLGHMAAFYRNSERMDPRAVLRVGLPAWAIDNMRADYLSTFIGGGAANWGLSDDEIAGFFQEHRLMPFLYEDGPSDISQLFVTTGVSGATGNGVTLGTPVAIPDYPGTGATTSFRTKVVSFMWAEGTWLGLTTGELNLGLVRDSILNAQNRFRNFQEVWETPAFVGTRSLRGVHTVAADGTYGTAASITLGVGSGI